MGEKYDMRLVHGEDVLQEGKWDMGATRIMRRSSENGEIRGDWEKCIYFCELRYIKKPLLMQLLL